MAFRLLKFNTPTDDKPYINSASTLEYLDRAAALESAKALCAEHGWHVIITQDVDEVRMAPLVSVLVPSTPPMPVMRSSQVVQADADEVIGPPRVAKSRPRLLIVPGRRATPAELVGNLMVVAEGKIVKNAFGGLELDDMPLTDAEAKEVASALALK